MKKILRSHTHSLKAYLSWQLSLREKCPYSELLWSIFSWIWGEYSEILKKIVYKKIEKYSVEISLKSINNSDITKNNTREEKAIATNATEINKDICDTQNNIVVDHIKMMQRMFMVTKFTIICRKTEDKETIASLRRVPKMIVIMEILYSNKKKFHVLLKNLRSSSEKKIDGYLLTSSIQHK